MHTVRTGRSQSWGKGHLSHEENTRALQLEVDQLKRKLRHAQRKRAPSSPDDSPDGGENASYKQRLRTHPVSLFSYEEENHHKRKRKSPPHRGLGNYAMSKVLN